MLNYNHLYYFYMTADLEPLLQPPNPCELRNRPSVAR